MEYIISKKYFEGAKLFGMIYYKGPFIEKGNKLILLEGELSKVYTEEINNVDPELIINNYYGGNYNFILYDSETNILRVKNDKLGKLLLYYFVNNNNFFISNNFWDIIRNISESDINLDKFKLKQYLYFGTNLEDGATYFKGIKKLTAASMLTLNVEDLIKSVEVYWDFKYATDDNLTVGDAVDILDNDLLTTFEDIKKRNPNKLFGFGNSGGLDSRLIAIYANEIGLPLVGYTIGNIKPNKFLYSTSFKNANQVAAYYGFNNFNIHYRKNNYDFASYLDIRNNTFGTFEIFKNTIEDLPEFDVLLTGQQGGFVGGGAFGNLYNNDDFDSLFQQIFLYTNFRSENLIKYKSKYMRYLRGIVKYLVHDKDKRYYNFNNNILEKSILDYIFTEEEISALNNHLKTIVEGKMHKSSPDIRWDFFHNIIGRNNFSGGFESLNRTKKTYMIYGQYNLENLLKWKYEFLYNREVLKELIVKKDKKVAEIPSQDLDILSGDKGLVNTIKVKAELLLRMGKGLDYYNWIKQGKFREFVISVLERKNPIFEELFDSNRLIDLGILDYMCVLNFVKVKRVLDIIYYKEFELLNNKNFTMN